MKPTAVLHIANIVKHALKQELLSSFVDIEIKTNKASKNGEYSLDQFIRRTLAGMHDVPKTDSVLK